MIIARQGCPTFSCNGLMSNSYAYFPLKKNLTNKALWMLMDSQ